MLQWQAGCSVNTTTLQKLRHNRGCWLGYVVARLDDALAAGTTEQHLPVDMILDSFILSFF
jgi:hypothetical protein